MPEIVAVPAETTVPPEFVGVVEANVQPPPTPVEPYRDTGLVQETANIAPRPLPAGFRARQEAGVHPSGWPLEITCDQDGAAMVLIPGGSFLMGRDDGTAVERPAHPVTLSPYYIDQHEVTVRQYRLFQRATGHQQGGPSSDGEIPDTLPVTEVNADDAYRYALWAGKAMPSEAQWEMAGRTIDGRIHPWGPGSPNWSRPREPKQVDPVVSFPSDMSPYGVFDLAGNVWEWTADWFSPDYYQQLAGKDTIDPVGPPQGQAKNPLLTVRGGSPEWDLAWRDGMTVRARLPYLGFRCVLPLNRPVAPAPGADAPGPGSAPAPGGAPAGIPPGQVPF